MRVRYGFLLAHLATVQGYLIAPLQATRAAPTRTITMQLPQRQAPNAERPEVFVTGQTTANLVYGKLQRAAQLPGSRLSATPFAAVAERGKLSSLLWSSFAMSSVGSGCWLDRDELCRSPALGGGLLFMDATTPEGAGGFNPFAVFGKGGQKPDGPPPLDADLIMAAGKRGAAHTFVMLDGDDGAVGVACDVCNEAVAQLAAEGVSMCVTLLAPVAGCSLASTPGWVADTSAQDHEGTLQAPLGVQVGWTEAHGLEPTDGSVRTLTLELTGCADEIGIGVDGANTVDLLKPRLPAALGGLLLGDVVTRWDGEPLYEERAGGERAQKRLSDVGQPGADSYTLEVERSSLAAVGGASIPREDLAELTVQCALRLARTPAEGAPPLRVVRVAPVDAPLAERPLSASTYDGLLAGPKGRKRMGVVRSADWATLLLPFGVVRVANPRDYRELIDATAA